MEGASSSQSTIHCPRDLESRRLPGLTVHVMTMFTHLHLDLPSGGSAVCVVLRHFDHEYAVSVRRVYS